MEIEAKFFVDALEVEKRLRELGYELEEVEQVNYFIGAGGWLLRARKEGERIIFTLKYGIRGEGGIKRAREVEFEVCGGFEKVLEILRFLADITGAEKGKYVKVVRRARVGGAEVELVYLSGFGSYVEIEGSEESIKKACDLLGIDFSKRSSATVLELLKDKVEKWD